MPDPSDYDHLRLDALREVGTIGAGHATSALATMTGRRIMIDVPAANVVELANIPQFIEAADSQFVVVALRVMGDLTGRALFILPETDALRLSDMLMERPLGTASELSLMERSSIEEAGNVVAAAYLNALSEFLGMMSMPSVPTLVVGALASVLESEMASETGSRDIVVCITTRFVFQNEDDRLSGYYIFLPDRPALKAILAALRLD